MSKKKNPEQEAPPVEDQEPETPAEQEETPVEDTPEQETPQEQEETEEQEAEDSEEEEPEVDPEEEQQEDQPDSPNQEPAAADESAALRTQLLQVQGELAAYRAGVAPGMVADAVTLAMAEASKSGEVTEAAVVKAMEAVLKRHPEWKAEADGKKKTGGFKIGADRDNAGTPKKPAGNNQNVKRWNRFK